jgi:predicted Ser/Thr protein kinase
MSRCKSCSTEAPAGSRYCLSCGARVGAEEEQATVALETPPRMASHPSLAAYGEQRFPPGTLLAGRYRIVARLGKGGMGEVYRADDLALGQPVALKFLPEAAARNVNFLKRFYDEVRIARQVAHPNVCRVYDIGEVDGQPFLSMQYIDGEDLSTLLRRIGRLPAAKATEFARKLCAGLAAAHAQGVLHRDIKPANIMVDSRGEVLITDFGLAGLAGQLEGAEVRNGTPAYMAPEQLAGREVSARSDLYALGLVFYEMYSGKPPHEASSVEEIRRLRESSAAPSLETMVDGLDPAVDRAIQRCLEADPRLRPASALELAAMLPGGNPLAEALAAGQTPSPEMVAAAGDDTAALRVPVAAAILGATLVGLAALYFLLPNLGCAAAFDFDNPPEVLEAKARDVARGLGYAAHPADRAVAYAYAENYLNSLNGRAHSVDEWVRLLASGPAFYRFTYRQSPRPLRTLGGESPGIVTWLDPPPFTPGMVSIELTPEGRLRRFEAVPPAKEAAPAGAGAVDWKPLLAAAGVDMGQLKPAEPDWTPPTAYDARAAWTVDLPAPVSRQARIEAAAYHGKPVYFRWVWPWSKPEAAEPPSPGWLAVLLLTIVAASVWMGSANLKCGRGDLRGARRLAYAAGAATFLSWLCLGHHVMAGGELVLFARALEDALLTAFVSWGMYIAFEPWVRRHWPQILISWSRLLAGRLNDPVVGRDLLFSALAGVSYCLLISASMYLALRGGVAPVGNFRLDNLLGGRAVAGFYFQHVLWALRGALMMLMLLFVLRLILRKEWLAAVAFVIILTASRYSGAGDQVALTLGTYVLIYALLVAILLRQGLLATVITMFIIDATNSALSTRDVFAWYGLSSLVAGLLVAGTAVAGFRLSIGRRMRLTETMLNA